MALVALVLLILKFIYESLSDCAMWPWSHAPSSSPAPTVMHCSLHGHKAVKVCRCVGNFGKKRRTVTLKGGFFRPISYDHFKLLWHVEQMPAFVPDP
jgi:hypothetical protein